MTLQVTEQGTGNDAPAARVPARVMRPPSVSREVRSRRSPPASAPSPDNSAGRRTLLIPGSSEGIEPAPWAVGPDAIRAAGSAASPSWRPARVVGPQVAGQRALGIVAWLFPTILMTFGGLIRLGWADLGSDELAVRAFARTPWSQVWGVLPDIGPSGGAYAILLRCWAVVFGTSDFALRLPSVMAIAAATMLTARMATTLAGPRAGLLAGLLLAAVPAASRNAQQAGPVALTLFAGALATWALLQASDRPERGRFVRYGWAVALLGLCQVGALVLLVGHLFLTAVTRRSDVPGWRVAAIFGGLPGGLVLALCSASWWRGAEPAQVSDQVPIMRLCEAVCVGAVVVLGLLAAHTRMPNLVPTMLVLATAVVQLPLLGIDGIDGESFLFYLLPMLAFLVACELGRRSLARGVAVVVAVVLIGLPAQLAIRQPDGHGQAPDELASVLIAHSQLGDALVFGPVNGDGQAARDLASRYIPADLHLRDVLAAGSAPLAGRVRTYECADVNACMGGVRGVWVIRIGMPATPLDGMEAAKDSALRNQYTVSQTWRYTGLTLTLFQRRT